MPFSNRLAAPAVLGVFLAGCAAKTPAKAGNVAAVTPASGMARVEKVREPLEVTPLELHFSGVRGSSKADESVRVKNAGNEAVQISEIRVVGTEASTFEILQTSMMPVILQPGRSFSFSVGFAPKADAAPGVHHARVRILLPGDDDGPPCDLTGLVARGASAADEPSLQQILEALGYDVDVGSKALKLPAHPSPIGDEIKAPIFKRAKPGTVGYYLIARYTADEASSFGYYAAKEGRIHPRPIGSAATGHNQTLNPELEGDSQTSFEPGEASFGLYLKVGKQTLYSEDNRNGPGRLHVAKVFPLHSRGRTAVQDAYVVAFDEDGDRDFQDHVFMLWNVTPAKR